MNTETIPVSAHPIEVPQLAASGRPKWQEKCLTPCATCPYGGPRVGSRGNPQAPIVVVAEGPGTQELKVGIPLYGPSGHVFWTTIKEALKANGFHPDEDVYVLNAMQCLPPRIKNDAAKNTALLAKGAAACRPRLMSLIEKHPRKLIVALGNHALRTITGNYGYKITQVRGKPLTLQLSKDGLPWNSSVLPVVHPAAILRGTGNYRQFKMDLNYAVELAAGKSPKLPIVPELQNSIAWKDSHYEYPGENYILCRTEKDVWACIRELFHAPVIAGDVETTGFNRFTDKLMCIGLAANPRRVHVVPEKYIPLLGFLFRYSEARFVWHNGKFDIGFLRPVEGCGKARVDDDTMLLSYALDEGSGIHDLEQVSGDLIGAPDYKDMLKPYLPKKSTSWAVIPKPVLYRYLAFDVSNTLQIYQIMHDWVMRDRHLAKLYTEVLMPSSEMLYHIEMYGIGICQNRVDNNARRLQKEIDDAVLKLNRVCRKLGTDAINPDSPQQVAKLWFDVAKIRPPRLGSRSTDKEVMDKLPKHPAVDAVRAYRKAAKAKSTYVDSIAKNLQPDGRIHATYLIHGTRTGRLSSRKPNMQNIPRDKRIRGMFYAGKGRVFIKADLNQAELRSLACLSGDEFLCEIYVPGGKRSLHKETAADRSFFPNGWDGGKTTAGDEQLMRAKAVNFGIVYGREAPSLSEEFDVPTHESQRWIDAWFKRSPKAKKFIDSCKAVPLKGKTLLTPFGRKKRHHIVTQENLHALQNEASNFPHQSIASDINLLGAIRARPLLRRIGFFLVNVVHDEVMAEGPDVPELIAKAKQILISCLEGVAQEYGMTRIPFKAEADIGRRWSIYRKELAS